MAEPTPEVTPAVAPATTLGVQPEVKPAAPTPEVKPTPEAAPEVKPEAKPVEYKFTAPEGMTLDEKAVEQFTGIAKELGVSPENAQKLIDLHFQQLSALAKTSVEANAKLWSNTQATWKKELDSDPILGGTSAKDAQTIIGKVLDEFGSREARQAFDLTGAGNNPAIVRMIYNMAKALSEGEPTPIGSPASKKGTSLGSIFYPDKTN